MRTIGVVTVGRSDYSIYLPVLRKILDDGELELRLFVTGTHLSYKHGYTVAAIAKDGMPISERIEMLQDSDSPKAIVEAMGRGTTAFATVFEVDRPDILLVLGDRFEMHAACSAAIPFCIPIAHLHGGELTFGAIDEQFRHSITKMSHLHFVSTEIYRKRVLQLGEEPWRVTVTGAPALDNLEKFEPLNEAKFKEQFEIKLEDNFILVTFHPVTLELENTGVYVKELFKALDNFHNQIIFTYPNADSSGQTIINAIESYALMQKNVRIVKNLSTAGYLTALSMAGAMVGNSSSGIIEAASFKLPVVNIGTRQEGRVRGENVIDVGYSSDEIGRGIQKALTPEFRTNELKSLENPYWAGGAAQKIIDVLKTASLKQHLLFKRFVDYDEIFQLGEAS